MLKKVPIILIIVALTCMLLNYNKTIVYSMSVDTDIYTIYDENFEFLFERESVEVGDGYLQNTGKYYEVMYVNDLNHTGIAKFTEYKRIPNAHVESNIKPIAVDGKRIAMYMTHNDESYVTGDGVDSVYGNGGIKDIALSLKNEFEKHLISFH